MRSLQWFALGVATYMLLSAIANHVARAATDPTTEQPVIRLQKPKDTKSHCILKITTQRFLIRSDGKMEYAGGFTMWTPCQ